MAVKLVRFEVLVQVPDHSKGQLYAPSAMHWPWSMITRAIAEVLWRGFTKSGGTVNYMIPSAEVFVTGFKQSEEWEPWDPAEL